MTVCTSVIVNRKKTIVGWNLDLLGMEHRVRAAEDGVYIEVLDMKEGWMPLFGANSRGDFVGMPTCWPFDQRSDPVGEGRNIIMMDIDFLMQKKTLQETREIAEKEPVYSVPGSTFMGSLSDGEGNVLHIIPGQGSLYYEKLDHKVLTNFSPYKMDSEQHPWMGWDRYQKAEAILNQGKEDFGAEDCFALLKEVSQEVCPTVVSMVYDVKDRTVYWCENREWEAIQTASFKL